jgi:hypothetical protein
MRPHSSVSRGIARAGSACSLLGLVISGLYITAPSGSQASTTTDVVRIEEDWELVLNEPSDLITAPQFHTVMSPFPHLDSLFAQLTWNYRELPDFQAGGLQMQGWNGDALHIQKSFGSNRMSETAETVTWTQRLETDGTKVTITIKDGQSATWGSFGYPANNMQLQGAIALANLNTYSSSTSVANSHVTYGANRVERLSLRAVRRYGPSGLIATDSIPHIVAEMQ